MIARPPQGTHDHPPFSSTRWVHNGQLHIVAVGLYIKGFHHRRDAIEMRGIG